MTYAGPRQSPNVWNKSIRRHSPGSTVNRTSCPGTRQLACRSLARIAGIGLSGHVPVALLALVDLQVSPRLGRPLYLLACTVDTATGLCGQSHPLRLLREELLATVLAAVPSQQVLLELLRSRWDRTEPHPMAAAAVRAASFRMSGYSSHVGIPSVLSPRPANLIDDVSHISRQVPAGLLHEKLGAAPPTSITHQEILFKSLNADLDCPKPLPLVVVTLRTAALAVWPNILLSSSRSSTTCFDPARPHKPLSDLRALGQSPAVALLFRTDALDTD